MIGRDKGAERGIGGEIHQKKEGGRRTMEEKRFGTSIEKTLGVPGGYLIGGWPAKEKLGVGKPGKSCGFQ